MRGAREPLTPAGIAAAAWLAAVAAIAAVRALTGDPIAASLASSADEVAAGAEWRLLTSALVVQGALPAAQIACTAALVWLVVRHLGGRVLVAVALASHVGATLVTYAGIGVLALAGAHDAARVAAMPDYGISAVAAGCLGALATAGWLGVLQRRRLAIGAGVAALLASLVLLPAHGELADAEHLLALLAGAAVAALALHDGGRADGDALRPARMPSLRRRARGARTLAG
jgi:hypothetical protein